MTLAPGIEHDALAHARATARQFAAAVDETGRFPAEALAVLRDHGMLGLLVPESAGGAGGRVADACRIATALGSECLSTALIWAMHSQQVAIMADHAREQWRDELEDIGVNGALVASATTEPGKQGSLRTAHAPLTPDGDALLVDRVSPVVSYGAEADYCLVTMRAGADRPETDVRYVLLDRGDGEVTGDWNAMGMRGTRSVPMRFEARVPVSRVLEQDYRRVALTTAIPVAHLAWTSAWYGAARGALDGFVAQLRDGGTRAHRQLGSELFATRLGDVRLTVDLLDALLSRLLERYESMRAAAAPAQAYEERDWAIALNGLKVAGSRLAFEAVDALVSVAGLARGYLRDDVLGLERTFRDLRSATLMVSNDELLQVNAKRMLLEMSPST